MRLLDLTNYVRSSLSYYSCRCWLGKAATGRAKRSFHSGQYSFSRNTLAAPRFVTLARRSCLTSRSWAVKKAAFNAPFGLRRIRRDPTDAQLAQAAAELRQTIGRDALLVTVSRVRRHREHRIAIRVYVHHAPVFLQVLPQHAHVLRRGIALHKAAPTPTGGVVDEPYQIAHWPTPFQPIVLGGVPLNQLAKGAAPRPPAVHLLQLARVALPQPRLDHPPPQSLVAQLDAMPLGQLLAREGWPEVVPIRLLQNLQRPDLHFSRYLAVGCSPP